MIDGLLFYYPTAFMLGVLHSFEPAHGKAVLAAYLVGSRRRVIDALLFGVVITIAHTFSVMVLGIGAWVAAERYMIVLTGSIIALAGGLLVLSVGFWMLLRWRVGACAHPGHGHHDHDLADSNVTNNGKSRSGSTLGQLVMVGIGGGLVPCPSGVAMLMTVVATGNLAQGLGLAVAFSLGAGVVVVVLSMVIHRASSWTPSWILHAGPVAKHLPLVSGLVVIGIGIWLSASAFLDIIAGEY